MQEKLKAEPATDGPGVVKSGQHARAASIDMSADEFRRLGHQLVDRLADYWSTLRDGPVTTGETPDQIRTLLGSGAMPEESTAPEVVLGEAAELVLRHSLFTGHPRFWGYINGSPAPIGALGDMLAAAVNPNVGGWTLSPVASEIEAQVIRWIAQLVGYPDDCGGILVSGGNMANFGAFLAARRDRADWDVRKSGLRNEQRRLLVYASEETHTWIHKATDLFGLGTDSIRWVPTDPDLRLDANALDSMLQSDRASGALPFLAVGSAGTVSTGAVDPLRDMAAICQREKMWFHVDGAYGAPAALLPDAPDDLRALALADSLALDPHKWLYVPFEAGCTLVRNPRALEDAFGYRPAYYFFGQNDPHPPINFYERGLQNSRGFRSLKVWLGLRQAGREGYRRMIADDVALSQRLHALIGRTAELEAYTQSLSINTFRYVPPGLHLQGEARTDYLNKLNQAVLDMIQKGGRAFVSNAVIRGDYVLRACIVNFRSTEADIDALPELIQECGRAAHRDLLDSAPA